ncbi:MAG: hypothetical protein AAGH76_13900 [Pseudomonadota bacterium]
MLAQQHSVRFLTCAALLTATALAEPRLADDPTGLLMFTDETANGDFAALNGAELSAARRGVRLDVYQHRSGDTQIDFGFDYEYTRYEYRNVPSRNRDLHRAHWPVRLTTKAAGHRLDAYVAPGIATSSNVVKDFIRRGSGEDWYVNGGFEFTSDSSSVHWIVGAAYDRIFGDDELYPVLGVAIEPTASTSVRLAYPVSRFTYVANDDRRLDLTVFPAGQLWHVRTDDFTGEFNYEMQAWRAQLRLSQQIWKRLSVDIGGGYEFNREHRFEGANAVPVVGDVDDAWFVRLGMRVSFTP